MLWFWIQNLKQEPDPVKIIPDADPGSSRSKMESNSFPDPFFVPRLVPVPWSQHPHCCSLPSLLIVTLSQILFLSLGYYLGLSILTVVLCLARKELAHLMLKDSQQLYI